MAHYWGVDVGESTCTADGCNKGVYCKTLCKSHYQRQWRQKPDEAKRKIRPPGECAVAGCARARRKRDWCEFHYSRWLRNGDVSDDSQSWVWGEAKDCVVCGAPVPDGVGFRRYCGRGCATIGRNGPRERFRECAQCGSTINLLARSPSGRLKHSNARLCRSCGKPSNLRRHIPSLVNRDGVGCGICGAVVDLRLTYPHPFSSSVDHVTPRARGGQDGLANYQLAHLSCNIEKREQVGYVIR